MITQFKPLIAPSLLAADVLNLEKEAQAMIDAGADLLHLDIMDNHFVPNLSFGPTFCQALRQKFPEIIIDVHLMVQPVDTLIMAFATAGASWISFHPEASLHIDRSLQLIKDANCQAGLVLNPATPLNILDYSLDLIDFVLVMSVNPGFGGQTFIPYTQQKIAKLREKLDNEANRSIRIAVDGGVNHDNIGQLSRMGADTFIAGSALFSTNDYVKAINDFRERIHHG